MKKLGWIIVALILIGGGYFVFRWYTRVKEDPQATFIKPRIEMSSFVIKSLSKEQTDADMKVLIDNAAPIGFQVDSLTYQIFIGNTKVMESDYPKSIQLAANDSSLITLPVTIHNQTLVKTLKELENRKVDSVQYTMKAQVFTDLPFLKDKPLELTLSKELPLYRMPKVKILDTDLQKLGLNETRMKLTTEITNENVFAYRFRETTYRVMLDGKEFAEGRIDTTVNIPAQGKAVLELPMEITLKQGIKAAFDMITKPEEVEYSFTFKTKVVNAEGNNTFQNSRMVMTSQGNMKELIQAQKAMGNKKEKGK